MAVEFQRESAKDKLSINTPRRLSGQICALIRLRQCRSEGKVGNPHPPTPFFCWTAPMPPTDVVISHWNLNQTINIRQLSCSKKQRCLHNTACQNTLAGFTVWRFWVCNCAFLLSYMTIFICLFTLLEFKSPESWIHMRKKYKTSSQDWIHGMWRVWPRCTH